MEKKCERCGRRPMTQTKLGPILALNYCATCSKDLCDRCMAEGCCGNVPALSGNADDGQEHCASPGCDAPITHTDKSFIWFYCDQHAPKGARKIEAE